MLQTTELVKERLISRYNPQQAKNWWVDNKVEDQVVGDRVVKDRVVEDQVVDNKALSIRLEQILK